MKARVNQQTDQVKINIISSPHDFSHLEEEIYLLIQAPIHQNIAKSLCDILEKVDNGILYKKLAIMVVDGSIPLGDDPTKASDEFKRRGIVLIVVAEGRPRYDISYFYDNLARNTGGEYILLEDVSRMCSSVIDSSIVRVDADLCMDLAYMSTTTSVIDNTDDQNEITDGVGDLAFDHDFILMLQMLLFFFIDSRLV
ncbi:unnamed protein product [Adineta steineri]|uniref:Uncharacterized protein n=1 Tax=Adineta steineri TaxID=433720 RepID=A0A818N874_9BILA|nr:unnamed protein product [Adineta steineri]CAF1299756.1 unnamed protein product [Adineta steineri]CAF3602016.1 unnamed protein product [Adineta steineri]CAF3871280.1 unnamed protein product [Adineta steineri]